VAESDNFTHLKSLPDGTLTQAEVAILVDEIASLNRSILIQNEQHIIDLDKIAKMTGALRLISECTPATTARIAATFLEGE
jgi:hypothetical protein